MRDTRSHAAPSPALPLSEVTRAWFCERFGEATRAQALAWPPIARGEHTLLAAPTGNGKTLAAFLAVIDRLLFIAPPPAGRGTRVVYVSPMKALAVDVERNLTGPLEGIVRTAARMGKPCRTLTVGVRTGDTSARDRRRIHKGEAELLITTPESLYLMLTSGARDALRSVDTVIIDEIHALVPNERGAHLTLSLERLEQLAGRPIQRIGLSATQRPLTEVARFLGGERPIAIADASGDKLLDLRLELPAPAPDAASATGWEPIHARLLELIRKHRSTLVFVNSRRLAERVAQALNELAGEELVFAHHGSVAPDQRARIEAQLKEGKVRGLVATSTLELGIDMGAIDLVVQVEPPPSVASGLQRMGRGGHQVGAVSIGRVIPKHRGDLLPCAALVEAMREGAIEELRYQRNPLDVLAQQLVAMVAMDDWTQADVFDLVRRAGPFAELPRTVFDQVVDMMSGAYAIDELAEIHTRIARDASSGRLRARQGTKRIAVVSGGTIPDRGTFGVYLADPPAGKRGRLGELDEEMVFESAVGDQFVLGASTWRIDDITQDRVVVSPAPGEGGKMPFWRGESSMRPASFGRRIGALSRRLAALSPAAAHHHLVADVGMAEPAAEALVAQLAEQQATSAVPTDTSVVIEVVADSLGERRVCLLTPLGAKVLAPWAMWAQAAACRALAVDVEVMWSNDGFILRIPEGAPLPSSGAPEWLLPNPLNVEQEVTELLASSPMFAGRFREAAGRALMLPRRFPGQRAPLWHTRRRAHDLLRGALRVRDFPLLLETYRKCLVDVFDLGELVATLRGIADGTIEVHTCFVTRPSPVASTVLFGYVASFMYEGDVPVLERRAAALMIDPARLREIIGETSLREVLDPDVLGEVEHELTRGGPTPTTNDGLIDWLRAMGDADPVWLRSALGDRADLLTSVLAGGQVLSIRVAGEDRVIPAEYAARYRCLGGGSDSDSDSDGDGADADPGHVRDLVRCFARRSGPFSLATLRHKVPLPETALTAALDALIKAGDVVSGGFRPEASEREYVNAVVLTRLRHRSLARVRTQLVPAAPQAYARFAHAWHGVVHRRRGLDAVLDALERLSGMALLWSVLERDVLPARVEGYDPSDLDTLAAAGEVVWHGIAPVGARDARVMVMLADRALDLAPVPDVAAVGLPQGARAVYDALASHGALFFSELRSIVSGFPGDILRDLWSLVWQGFVRNDTFHPLRQLERGDDDRNQVPDRRAAFRSRRQKASPGGEGRWTLIRPHGVLPAADPTLALSARANQWLDRHGVVSPETAAFEEAAGGFAAVYPVLRALEENGRIRRGHFVDGMSPLQFARPAALDLLRRQATPEEPPTVTVLAAVDCANPYGSALPWPQSESPSTPRRSAGAIVITISGRCVAWASRHLSSLFTWALSPADARLVAAALYRTAKGLQQRGAPATIETIDSVAAANHPFAADLRAAGFLRIREQLVPRRDRVHLD